MQIKYNEVSVYISRDQQDIWITYHHFLCHYKVHLFKKM